VFWEALILLLLPVACAPQAVNDTTTTTTYGWTGTTRPQPTTSTTTSSDEETDEDTTGGTTAATTGHPDTTGILPDFGGDGLGCGGKIDFLFVLDRWKLSEPYWGRLDAALQEMRPKFVDWFANFDTHWMVVDGEDFWGLWACHERCEETNGVTCAPDGPPDCPCAPHTDNSITECDIIDGAGRMYQHKKRAHNDTLPLYFAPDIGWPRRSSTLSPSLACGRQDTRS